METDPSEAQIDDPNENDLEEASEQADDGGEDAIAGDDETAGEDEAPAGP